MTPPGECMDAWTIVILLLDLLLQLLRGAGSIEEFWQVVEKLAYLCLHGWWLDR